MRKKKETPVEEQRAVQEGSEPAQESPAPAEEAPVEEKSQKPEAALHHRHKPHHAKAHEAKPAVSDQTKTYAVAALAVLVIFLAFYFLVFAGTTFAPGNEVSAEEFKGLLISAQKVYIVMDTRGTQDAVTRGNILQCGVDFSASTFLGSKKEVVPFSLGDNECFGPDGSKPVATCMAQLKDGLTIDIREGPGGVKYYSNGMIVMVGPEYKVGGCGIKMN